MIKYKNNSNLDYTVDWILFKSGEIKEFEFELRGEWIEEIVIEKKKKNNK